MLEAKDMTIAISGKRLIEDASFSFPTVGTSLILGANGAGKSTLFRCLAGLQRFDGQISWNGEQPDGRVFVAFEDPPLHKNLTGYQNLCASLDMRMRDVISNPSTTMFSSHEVLSKRARKLSFGQQKRVSLTTAFMTSAPCLILDEPTVGLDYASLKGLSRAIVEAAKSRSVVMSGHQLDFFEGLADRVFLIKDRRVIDMTSEWNTEHRGGLDHFYAKHPSFGQN
ncbi:ABC transporter ATP-binding protein [Sinomonas sp. ASV322]|uniref:ABC transporter ATP-binding protein n=1 Tax=Sinomonas sp. ASV322 TaxID=3041920 RepID=UPI0027DE8F7B|nr:ABC transporter ATP-binding protein [Sinomonas sp. ASV322]MDQ4502558.1 ABC transporter ATP-binding protein [Sinomonas sp. ASV322]